MKYINIELNKIDKKKALIIDVINDLEFPVLNRTEFEVLISEIKNIWGLRSISRKKIKNYILTENFLTKDVVKINEDHSSEIFHIQNLRTDIFDVASARSRNSYFSYYSALYIHGLTLQIPKQIYLTLERNSYVDHKNILQQGSIDNVFSKPPRITSNKRNYKNFDINFINGQHQNNIGVVSFREKYAVSDLERTLIDISVRPFYSGGVTQVLEAFGNARERLDLQKFYDYFTKMNFSYPYHQVIGFYLERSGYSKVAYLPFLEFGRQEFDFYLTYNILHKEYSAKWKLHYPKGL